MDANETNETDELTEILGESEMGRWFAALLRADDRVVVILAGSRIESELEALLKKALHHSPGDRDPLFDTDRACGTFSAKIMLSYKLGLIDRDFESACTILRRLRNDFAHARSELHLTDPAHRDRIGELRRLAFPDGLPPPIDAAAREAMGDSQRGPKYTLCVVLFSMSLVLSEMANRIQEVDLGCVATFDVNRLGSDRADTE